MTPDRTTEALHTIAVALSPQPQLLPGGADGRTRREPPDALAQTAALLEAFAAVTDAQARRECVAFVRARRGRVLGSSAF